MGDVAPLALDVRLEGQEHPRQLCVEEELLSPSPSDRQSTPRSPPMPSATDGDTAGGASRRHPPPQRAHAAATAYGGSDAVVVHPSVRAVNADHAVEWRDDAHFIFTEERPSSGGSGDSLRRGQHLQKIDSVFWMVVRWVFVSLLILFLCFIVFGILYSSIRYGGEGYTMCETPFGNILGVHGGVLGFSNCNSAYVSDTEKYVMVRYDDGRTEEVFSGMPWQCVEFARRFWILQGSPAATFDGVDGAADIWDLPDVLLLGNRTRVPLQKFTNGEAATSRALQRPRVNDLLIYKRQSSNDFPFGHVAVVVGVEGNQVFVAEQNWESVQWPGPWHNYSRALPLSLDPASGAYVIDDVGDLQGWVRYEA